MNYRSFQGMFAETTLEQKCRIWFGISLFVLVVGAFWCVDYIAEKLVNDSTNEKGRDFVDQVLLKIHWEAWENSDERKPFVREMIRDLQNQRYSHRLIALRDEQNRPPLPTQTESSRAIYQPEEGWEEEALPSLRKEWLDHMRDKELWPQKIPGAVPAHNPSEATVPIEPKHRGQRVQGGDQEEFHYYQPVYWKESCVRCHRDLTGAVGALPAGDLPAVVAEPPFRVVKVVMPYSETRQAINWTRAILITTAIVTVVLAMVVLYLVVRYVIVKPLQHLRDVSDEVSRGNTDLRAELHTSDEFEELGDAFNRMLRSLVEAQEKLRVANTDLDTKVAELARMNIQLYEMNRLKSDFLASMSHELRTPLNSILGFSEELRGIDVLNNKQKRFVENILNSGRQLLEMINDVLDLAKMESGKMEVRPSEFRIDTIVDTQCDLMRPESAKKNIDLNVRIAPDLPPLYQDRNKVLQILTNLLSNAIKFTPEGGRITVSALRDAAGKLALTVTDTGVGIAAEDHQVIFEKFRQGSVKGDDNLTREYSGTGLGLSIVREICNLLGGEITFTSELGKGSVFTVLLPWNYELPRPISPLANKLDDLTRPRLSDVAAPHPSPPTAGVGS